MRSEPAPTGFRIAVLLAALVCAALTVLNSGFAGERNAQPPSEYEVKAAFVYNFIKFVDWPEKSGVPADSVRLCVLGSIPDTASFSALGGRPARGKRISVTAIRLPEESPACDVLFVAANQTGRLSEILGHLEGRPVLTIGDTEGYARRGIMINMFLEKKHVRFEINEEWARAAGLRISVKLLKLSSRLYGETSTE